MWKDAVEDDMEHGSSEAEEEDAEDGNHRKESGAEEA